MARSLNNSEIVVIFDGDCAFCRSSLRWLEQKLQLNSQAFQDTDLSIYGLTTQECSRSVYVISKHDTYSGADAIAFLLGKRGNSIASGLLRFLGPFGRVGYRWIASHRNSLVVRIIKWFLDRSNKKAKTREGQDS